jgi:hypothetical protein
MGRFLRRDPKGAPISSVPMTLLWSPESIHDLLVLRTRIAVHDPAATKTISPEREDAKTGKHAGFHG